MVVWNESKWNESKHKKIKIELVAVSRAPELHVIHMEKHEINQTENSTI